MHEKITFSINRNDLVDSIQFLDGCSTTKEALPVHHYVRFKTIADNTLELRAVSLSGAVRAEIVAVYDTNFSFCVHHQNIKKLISLLKDELLTFELKSNGSAIKIVSGRSKYEFAIMNDNIFPQHEFDINNKKGIEIEGSILKTQLKAGQTAMGKTNKGSYVLSALCMKIRGGKIHFTGTDGAKIMFTSSPIDYNGVAEKEILLPKTCVDNMIKFCGQHENVELVFTNRNLQLNGDKGQLLVQLTAGNYPDATKVIQPDYEYVFYIDSKEFLNSIKRALLTSLESKLKLKLSASELILESKNTGSGHTLEYVDVDIVHAPDNEILEFYMSALHILPCLEFFNGELEVSVTRERRAVKFVPVENDYEYIYAAMPLVDK